MQKRTAFFSSGIREGRKEERKEGRKKGRKEGRRERRKITFLAEDNGSKVRHKNNTTFHTYHEGCSRGNQ